MTTSSSSSWRVADPSRQRVGVINGAHTRKHFRLKLGGALTTDRALPLPALHPRFAPTVIRYEEERRDAEEKSEGEGAFEFVQHSDTIESLLGTLRQNPVRPSIHRFSRN